MKFFNGTKVLVGLMTVAVTLLVSSCGNDDAPVVLPDDNDIVSIAVGNDDLTSLVAALTKYPDLVAALSSDDETYTVFAPTNAAFEALLGVIGQDDIDDLPESVLRRVLEYHVVAGAALFSTGLTDGATATTILEEDVTIGIDGTTVTVNGSSTVTTPDVEASNGVIHIVDGVLVPELELSIVNTIVEPAYFSADFTILTAAVVEAGLLNTLIAPDATLTLFAPNNDAFEEAGITSLDDFTADELEAVLLYHVLGSIVKEEALPPTGSAVETLGGKFYLSINSTGVFINGLTQVTNTDLEYDNGVVHTINRTLVPASQNVVEIAVAASQATDAEFTQLVAALTAVEQDASAPNLITILSGADGTFTVFAPTDAAFQALYALVGDQDGDSDEDINDLLEAVGNDLNTIATVLQYHVLGSRVFSADIPNVLDGNTTATIQPLAGGSWTLNSDLTITDTDGALSLGSADASIISTDILGTNGVIHVIDQVILP